MPKSILGDDPFSTPGAPAKPGKPAEAKPAPASRKAAPAKPKPKAKAKAAKTPRAKVPATETAPSDAPLEPDVSIEIEAPVEVADGDEVPRADEPAEVPLAAREPEPAPEPAIVVEMVDEPAGPDEVMPPPISPPPVERPAATSAAGEYGPSIDRPPPPGHRKSILEEVREVEQRVVERIAEVRDGGSLAPAAAEPRKPSWLEPVLSRWRKLAMRDRSEVVDEFGLDPQVATRMDPLLDFFYKSWFRVTTDGIGHVPEGGRALIVANHSGTLPYDGAMIMHAIRREHPTARHVRPLVEDFVFHFPYLGTLMNRIGGVRACQENAVRLLESDQLVAVFPEGIKGIGKLYRERYQLQRFGRGGFIKLALSTDSPIIPTAVVGAEEIHPMLTKVTWLARSVGIPYLPITPTFPWLGPLGLVPLPTKWWIVFGEPLYFNAEYGAAGASDSILVNRLAEQVRHKIQEMIDGLLAARSSIWR